MSNYKNIDTLKFNIPHNERYFNSLEILKLGLNSDDITIISWIKQFTGSSKIKTKVFKDGKIGYWVDSDTIIESIPFIFKDTSKFLEEYQEIKTLEFNGDLENSRKLKDIYYNKYRKKLSRIFNGNLSKVLERRQVSDVKAVNNKVVGNGSKTYVIFNDDIYDTLVNSRDTIEIEFMKKQLTKQPYREVKNDIPNREVKNDIPNREVKNDIPNINTNNLNTIDLNTTNKTKSNDFVCGNKKTITEQVKIIRERLGLPVASKDHIDKASSWNIDRLIKSIDIYLKENGRSFKFLSMIYANDRNFIQKNESSLSNKSNKTNKFHNFTETFTQYTPEELDKIIEKSQRKKFNKEIVDGNENVDYLDENKIFYEKAVNDNWNVALPILDKAIEYAKKNNLDYLKK